MSTSGRPQVPSSECGGCGPTLIQRRERRADSADRRPEPVHDNVIVSHRGARFEIGRGAGFYAIWPAGAAEGRPIEWWPETPDGWQAAWARFTDVEPRRAIHRVTPPTEDPTSPQTGATHVSPAGHPPGPDAIQSPDQPFGQGQPLEPWPVREPWPAVTRYTPSGGADGRALGHPPAGGAARDPRGRPARRGDRDRHRGPLPWLLRQHGPGRARIPDRAAPDLPGQLGRRSLPHRPRRNSGSGRVPCWRLARAWSRSACSSPTSARASPAVTSAPESCSASSAGPPARLARCWLCGSARSAHRPGRERWRRL